MTAFRVALSTDFRNPDGSPSFLEFDLSPLADHPDIELFYLEPETSATQLADVDALILLTPRVEAASLAPNGRLAVVRGSASATITWTLQRAGAGPRFPSSGHYLQWRGESLGAWDVDLVDVLQY